MTSAEKVQITERSGGTERIDRVATATWLMYPAALWTLPNYLKLGGAAPETWFAASFLAVFLVSVVAFRRPVDPSHLLTPFPWAWLMFASIFYFAIALRGSILEVVQATSWMGVSLLGVHLFQDDRLRLKLWWTLVITGTTVGAVSLYILPLPLPEEVNVFAWSHRTVLGYFMAMALLAAIHLSYSSQGTTRFLLLLSATVLLTVLIGSLARGAWLATLSGIVVLLGPRPRRVFAVLFLAFIVGWIVGTTTGALDTIGSRVVSITDVERASSTLYRVNVYFAAIQSLPETWLFGAGTLEFGPYLAGFSPIRYPHFFDPEFATDSDFVHLLLLGGAPLLAAFGLLWAKLIKCARLVLRATKNDERLRVGILCVLGVQAVLDNVFSSALGWFFVSIVLTLHLEALTVLRSKERNPIASRPVE